VPKLSITVITLNEADRLRGALESVAWADEIVVVDSGSSDETVSIAREHTDRVVSRPWPGYGAQKNVAASLATHDWVLSIDADERVTPDLAQAIQRTLAREPDAAAYRFPRLSWHLGRWVRTTDWYPDHQARLYDRRRARWTERKVHEGLEADGPIGTLDAELQHFPYRNVAHHLATINRYTTLWAEDAHQGGRRAGVADLIVQPQAAFLRNYLLRRGVMDGAAGLIISLMNSWYVALKYAKLWELQHGARPPGTKD
jgi:glycosyltransferase involved in cell wall biosynthesis